MCTYLHDRGSETKLESIEWMSPTILTRIFKSGSELFWLIAVAHENDLYAEWLIAARAACLVERN